MVLTKQANQYDHVKTFLAMTHPRLAHAIPMSEGLIDNLGKGILFGNIQMYHFIINISVNISHKMYGIAYNLLFKSRILYFCAQKPIQYLMLHQQLSTPPLPTISDSLRVNEIFSLFKGSGMCLEHDFEIAIIFSDKTFNQLNHIS